MEKNECVATIEKYLNEGNIESKVFLVNKKQKFKDLYVKLMKNVTVLENDGIPQNYFEKEINGCLKYLRNNAMDVPISNNDVIFIKAWCEFINNINDNTLQSEEIHKRIIFIIRLVDQYLTVKESIEILKSLNKKFRDMKG